MYRSGDLARYMPDGSIEFLGRKDFQVKLRGYRIELHEIEAVLRSHPEVKDALVMLQGESPEDVKLIAYVIPNAEASLTEQVIDSYLRKTLPAYMIPTGIIFLDAFPSSPSGKVDRQALPLYKAQASAEVGQEAPQTSIERALEIIWASVLGIDRVGRRQSFFDLGGHSLLAVRLAAKVADVFQIRVPLSMIFEYPSIAAMADALQILGESKQQLEAIAELFLKVSMLSDEEVEHELQSLKKGKAV